MHRVRVMLYANVLPRVGDSGAGVVVLAGVLCASIVYVSTLPGRGAFS